MPYPSTTHTQHPQAVSLLSELFFFAEFPPLTVPSSHNPYTDKMGDGTGASSSSESIANTPTMNIPFTLRTVSSLGDRLQPRAPENLPSKSASDDLSGEDPTSLEDGISPGDYFPEDDTGMDAKEILKDTKVSTNGLGEEDTTINGIDSKTLAKVTKANTDCIAGPLKPPSPRHYKDGHDFSKEYSNSVFWKTDEEEGDNESLTIEYKVDTLLALDELIDAMPDDEECSQLYEDNPWLYEDIFSWKEMSHLIRFGPFKNKKEYLDDLNLKRVWMDTSKNEIYIVSRWIEKAEKKSVPDQQGAASKAAILEGAEYQEQETGTPNNSHLPYENSGNGIAFPDWGTRAFEYPVVSHQNGYDGPSPLESANGYQDSLISSYYTPGIDASGSEFLQLAPPCDAPPPLNDIRNSGIRRMNSRDSSLPFPRRAHSFSRNSDGHYNRVEAFVPNGPGVKAMTGALSQAEAVSTVLRTAKHVHDFRLVDEYAGELVEDNN